MTERKADPVATLTRKCLVLAFLSAYVFNLGCSSIREVPMSDELTSANKVHSVTLKNGDFVEFNEDGGTINSYRGTIDGKDRHERAISVKLDNVQSARVDEVNTAKSLMVGVVILGAMAAAFYWLFIPAALGF